MEHKATIVDQPDIRLHWTEHPDEIGPIFDQLMQNYRKDPAGPTVEFYRSQAELQRMIPLQKN
jgi:hypothetical protein